MWSWSKTFPTLHVNCVFLSGIKRKWGNKSREKNTFCVTFHCADQSMQLWPSRVGWSAFKFDFQNGHKKRTAKIDNKVDCKKRETKAFFQFWGVAVQFGRVITWICHCTLTLNTGKSQQITNNHNFLWEIINHNRLPPKKISIVVSRRFLSFEAHVSLGVLEPLKEKINSRDAGNVPRILSHSMPNHDIRNWGWTRSSHFNRFFAKVTGSWDYRTKDVFLRALSSDVRSFPDLFLRSFAQSKS